MTSVQSDRAKAAGKALKVFRQGISTTATGEKEKCVGLLSRLFAKHNLNLSDLDPSFPKSVDLTLLRRKIGLVDGNTQATPDKDPKRADKSTAQRERETAAWEQREKEEKARRRREEHARQRAAYQQNQQKEQERVRAEQRRKEVSRDPEVLLFQHLNTE